MNFASIGAGAVVLESSAAAKGYSNLLHDDKDKYGISPCSEKMWVVIGLSEDIMVHTVVVANWEKYSSFLRDFQIMGSSSYPVSEWLDLGSYIAEPKLGEQTFEITTRSWARYLKFRFLTHFGDEFYCTLSQIRVHGSTILENFKQEVERSDEEVRHMQAEMKAEVEPDLNIALQTTVQELELDQQQQQQQQQHNQQLDETSKENGKGDDSQVLDDTTSVVGSDDGIAEIFADGNDGTRFVLICY